MSREYENLADEYYDERAHPTIALLRAGSRESLLALRDVLFGHGGLFAEVGSGRGMLHAFGRRGIRIVSFDLNAGMLRAVPGLAVLADATSLPVRDAIFDGIFASLCDPYNTESFLRESRRVLKPGGRLLMTTPDHRWVRRNQEHEGVMEAAVVVSKAGPMVVPSFVHSHSVQVELLGTFGFSDVKVHDASLDSAIKATGIVSPRLLDQHGNPISPSVTNAYLAR